MIQRVKCVVVGDGFVGKTALLMSYCHNSFPTGYIPTVFDTYEVTIMVEGRPVTLGLWDTAGQECYDRLRLLSYNDVNVFVVCYDVNNIDSLENVLLKWYPEIAHHCPNPAVVLVGTKNDLRNPRDRRTTTAAQGYAMAAKIKAHAFLECSALTKQGVNDVFVKAVMAALKPVRREPRKRCFIF